MLRYLKPKTYWEYIFNFVFVARQSSCDWKKKKKKEGKKCIPLISIPALSPTVWNLDAVTFSNLLRLSLSFMHLTNECMELSLSPIIFLKTTHKVNRHCCGSFETNSSIHCGLCLCLKCFYYCRNNFHMFSITQYVSTF